MKYATSCLPNMPTALLLLAVLLLCSCDYERHLALDVSADQSKQQLNTYSDYPVSSLIGWNVGLFISGNPEADKGEGEGFFPSGVLTGNVSHAQGFGYNAGLVFIQKGYNISGGGGNVHLNYLEVPIQGTYQYPLGPGAVMAGLGPYVAYGIGGKADGQSSFGDGTNDVGYKRFDAGLTASAKYELDMGLSLTLGYEYGLTNVAYKTGDLISAKNRTLSLSIGFEFGHLLNRSK